MLREHRSLLWRLLLDIDLIKLLDRRRTIERPLYRYHYAFGAVVTVGTIAILATLWALRDDRLMTRVLPEILGDWGAETVILTIWALAVFVLGIGLFLLIRPSALKGLDIEANRWIEPFPSSPKNTAPVETGLQRLTLRAPRVTGLLLLAAGLACLLTLAR